MAATEVTLKSNPVSPQEYDTGGYLRYTYERIGDIVRYYVEFNYVSGRYYPSMSVAHEATINGITLTGTGSVNQGYRSDTFTLGPWDVEISSPVDTTLPGCSARITGSGGIPPADSFDAVVPAGGVLTIPVLVNVDDEIVACDAAYFRTADGVEECEIYTNVNGTIRKIG